VKAYLIILALLLIACFYRFRIQSIDVPVFINLHADKYIIIRQDTVRTEVSCGWQVKRVYYVRKLRSP
jgi:hypothetical protein